MQHPLLTVCVCGGGGTLMYYARLNYFMDSSIVVIIRYSKCHKQIAENKRMSNLYIIVHVIHRLH